MGNTETLNSLGPWPILQFAVAAITVIGGGFIMWRSLRDQKSSGGALGGDNVPMSTLYLRDMVNLLVRIEQKLDRLVSRYRGQDGD